MKAKFTNNQFNKFKSWAFMLVLGLLISGMNTVARAQIYEPEGLNMPGAWNTWTNPPANNLALASSTQVPGGRVTKITTGTPRWQTTLKVAATGGDLTAGTYEWLFTSGAAASAFQNKWAAVNVVVDSLQMYTKEGATNNSITLEDNKYYTMNWEDIGYVDSRAIFMKTSAEPVEFVLVTIPTPVYANSPANISIVLASVKSPEENIFARYSTDNWATSSVVLATVSGFSAIAQIPGQPAGTIVSFYVFSSTKSILTADYDLYTIRLKNDMGVNYTYTVVNAPASITYANLDHPGVGFIQPYQLFEVFGNVEIPGITGQATPAPGLEAWIGWSQSDTDPSTWTNWISAPYHQAWSWYDQFKGNLGGAIATQGRYYYATRYKYNSGNYVYGGYGTTASGFWNGNTSISGILDVWVGMDEIAFPGLKIYPNPATDVVYLEIQETVTATLSDVLGKIIFRNEFSSGHHQINVGDLKPGAYVLCISANGKIAHRTIIKQ